MKTTNSSTECLNEIIRLQLKKPKRWNWELSTSKSSPHIALPVIQLCDSKGKLLLEAKGGGVERKTWHSANVQVNGARPPAAEDTIRPLARSKSDVFDRNKCKRDSINHKSTGSDNKVTISDNKRLAKEANDQKIALYKLQKLKSDDQSLNHEKSSNKKRLLSDDIYKRLLKRNEELIKDEQNERLKPKTSRNSMKHQRDRNDINESETYSNPVKSQVNRVKHSRYIMRTCSAGTLVIKEESFSNPNVRRRRKTADERESASQRQQNRYSSADVVSSGRLNVPENVYTSRDRCLFYSKSDVFPFNELLSGKSARKCDDSCNYVVQEPTDSSRKSSQDVDGGAPEKHEKRKRRTVRRRYSDGSTSSGSAEDKPSRKWKGNDIKARVVKEHKRDQADDAELLRLVRRLSTDHVKMGANVSRHSSKGLSGRRSQSSGSICNGKGRHGSNEQKICGSLPSYLDDRDGTGCNNNHHDCEKPPLEDVERIPPLGDGAPLHWKFSDNQTTLCDQGYGSERSPEEEYPPPLPEHDNQCHHHLDLHSCYPFITPESTFTISLAKGSRGLGLSVTGGVDSGGSWPGLIRVKRLFPHQPAAASEMLNVGDLILEANGITLTGLTNYEALEVLRTAPNQVELKLCRPPPDVLSCVSPISEVPPPPPRRDPPSSLSLPSVSDDDHCHGEFEVTMRKLQGSLGFTLRKEDDSALGHYIRALVREPALTDGRIRAGDKIIAVNDVEISPMSHEEAVQFLRQSGDIVKLRLYRDLAQTPVATLSPTETTPRTSFSKKAQLRQEAVDMLNDIAVRKLIPGGQETYRRSLSPNASPRRLRRPPCPSDASHVTDSSKRYLITDEQFHEGLLKKCSLPLDEDSFNSLFIEDDDCDRPSRPSSLDLYNPNQTPVASRKPKFNFSLAHNAYELNNLDADILDAPNLTYNMGNEDVNSTEVECGDSFPQEPASMPHIPTDNPCFSHKNPAYQSAHPQCGVENCDDKTPKPADDSNMKKWKGVVFSADEEKEMEKKTKKEAPKREEDTIEILPIELNRGWNSRLGFSLQGAAGVTYVSAVHADSVAARDGRIKPGDRLIKVNDESVEHMSTGEIIDLLRIVRGPVCIVISRTKSKEDCTKGNALN